MTPKKKRAGICLLLLIFAALICFLLLREDPRWQQLSPQEQQLRMQVINQAKSWLGRTEADGSHKEIIDLYNSHRPLAQGYLVQYDDSWCATFVSAVAISCNLTDIIPTECGCQRQISLFQDLGVWQEKDSHRPLPGDIIYYCRTDSSLGDCTGWSDHVGIVVQVHGPILQVLEGNYDSSVKYRYIPINAPTIRGFALPDYGSKT